MSPTLARFLTRLYPHYWRERYGNEFEDLLQTGDGELGTVGNVVWTALRERLRPTPGLRSDAGTDCAGGGLFGQAPWLDFGLAPVVFLFLSYFVACLVLWSGWRSLLPGSSTPFVPISGVAVLYFGFGRLLYFGAPFVIGWAISFRAATQGPRATWPAVGLLAIALVGSAAHVNASRASVGAAECVGMDFSRLPFLHGNGNELLHAVLILSLTGLPLLIWRSLLLTALYRGHGKRSSMG